MGFLAEDACRALAAVIEPDTAKRRALLEVLRRFMAEAKKGLNQ
jgi:hypothetical protein